jgi:hypothetical protein
MSLQARMSEGDRRLYNPSRDVAHNFKEVMDIVAGRLEDHKWPELADILGRERVSMDEVGEACGCYCTYLSSAANPDMIGVSMVESLKMSGFFECKPAAQVAVLAMIGTCYAGIQFGGIREASIGGEGPMETIAEVVEHAARLHKYTGMPRWRRRLEDFKRRLVNTCKAIKGE